MSGTIATTRSDPYRTAAEQQVSDPVGHPLLDQSQGVLVDPGVGVTVYERSSLSGEWRGTGRVAVRSSRTHLEHKCPILGARDVKITEWSDKARWLP